MALIFTMLPPKRFFELLFETSKLAENSFG